MTERYLTFLAFNHSFIQLFIYHKQFIKQTKIMRKVTNYLWMFMMAATVLFVTSCGEDPENPTPSTISISFADTVQTASPGDTVTFTPTLGGVNADVEATVTSNPSGTFVDGVNTVTSGEDVSFIIPITASPGDSYTLTFTVTDGNAQQSEQASIVVAFSNVVDVAASNDDFTILATALQDAGLIATLSDDDTQFTVFAPTNAAFEAIGITEDNVSDFDLTDILTYHVISGTAAFEDDLTTGDVETLGGTVYVNTEGGVTVNGVTVATADLAALNGVVHVVGSVLTPTSFTAVLLAAPLASKASKTFFSTITGATYSVDDVNNSSAPISALVDFGYYFGVTGGAAIASPDSYPTVGFYDLNAEGWGTIRNTDFKTVDNISAEQFDAIDAGASPSSVSEGFDTGTDPENTGRVTNLAVDQVVAFRTGAGRFGLFKVVAIEEGTGAGDSITLDVKMTN